MSAVALTLDGVGEPFLSCLALTTTQYPLIHMKTAEEAWHFAHANGATPEQVSQNLFGLCLPVGPLDPHFGMPGGCIAYLPHRILAGDGHSAQPAERDFRVCTNRWLGHGARQEVRKRLFVGSRTAFFCTPPLHSATPLVQFGGLVRHVAWSGRK